MPWGQLTAEDLKKAGVDPDVIKDLATKMGEVAGVKSAVDEMKQTVEGLKGIKESLAALETKLTNFKPAEPKGKEEESKGKDEEEELNFVLDPEAAVRKMIQREMAPATLSTAQMRSDMIYANFKASNPRGFIQLEAKIKEMWNKEHISMRQNPKVIENIYKIVLADNVDEIIKEPKRFFVEVGGGGTNKTGTEEKKPEEILTKDQLEIAAKWGVEPKDYLEELKKTQYA